MASWLGAALAALSSSLVACESTTDIHWKGAAFPLRSGAPTNTCERAEWYEVARAWIRAPARAGATYTRVYEGLAVFRYGSSTPERLDEVVPKMGEPDLEPKHAYLDPNVAVAVAAGAFGLVGAVTVAALQTPEEPEVGVRNTLFIEGEDAKETVVRGINHANEERRRQCAEVPNETEVRRGPAPHEW